MKHQTPPFTSQAADGFFYAVRSGRDPDALLAKCIRIWKDKNDAGPIDVDILHKALETI